MSKITRKENLARSEYDRLINNHWRAEEKLHPDGIIPSEQEAITGIKRLYRSAMGRPFKGVIKFTTGNRRTWGYWSKKDRKPEIRINRQGRRGYYNYGWREIVHDLSHWCNFKLNPRDKGHSNSQLSLESKLTRYAISNGFLQGKLKSKKADEIKKPINTVAKNFKKLLARKDNLIKQQKRHSTNLKRASSSLKEVEKKIAGYQKKYDEERLTAKFSEPVDRKPRKKVGTYSERCAALCKKHDWLVIEEDDWYDDKRVEVFVKNSNGETALDSWADADADAAFIRYGWDYDSMTEESYSWKAAYNYAMTLIETCSAWKS